MRLKNFSYIANGGVSFALKYSTLYKCVYKVVIEMFDDYVRIVATIGIMATTSNNYMSGQHEFESGDIRLKRAKVER
jgi:hypothetical protein